MINLAISSWEITNEVLDTVPAPKIRLHRYSDEEISLIGSMSDKEVAIRIGRTEAAIRTKRLALDLPSVANSPNSWSKEELEQVGKVPDVELALKLGRSRAAVAAKRRQLGIVFEKGALWSDEEIQMLATEQDAALSKRFRRSRQAIRKKRLQLGIAKPPPPAGMPKHGLPWSQKEDDLFARLEDGEVARETGRTLAAVMYRRQMLGLPPLNPRRFTWTAASERLLGTMPDRAVAQALKCEPSTVGARRKALGIPVYQIPGTRPWTRADLTSWELHPTPRSHGASDER